jgi:MYXO-CTERM domain-containing protein
VLVYRAAAPTPLPEGNATPTPPAGTTPAPRPGVLAALAALAIASRCRRPPR